MELQKLAEQLKNLSQEDIAQIESIINKPKKSIYPMTWEDAISSRSSWYVTGTGRIDADIHSDTYIRHNSVLSEQRAKSVLAYSKLSVIIDVMNSQWKDTTKMYTIAWFNSKPLIIDTIVGATLICYSFEIVNHVVTTFPDLLKDYFMINN